VGSLENTAASVYTTRDFLQFPRNNSPAPTTLSLSCYSSCQFRLLSQWWSVESRPKFKCSSPLTEVQNDTSRPTYWQNVEFFQSEWYIAAGSSDVWQSPAVKDVSRRGYCWEPLPDNHWWRQTEMTQCLQVTITYSDLWSVWINDSVMIACSLKKPIN
jgi:hypothetical protein